MNNFFKIGCHVSAAGGVFNAPKNAAALGCETFQIFTRPPMGGPAPKLTDEIVEQFKVEMGKYYPKTQPLPTSPLKKGRSTAAAVSPSFRKSDEALCVVGSKRGQGEFVVHCPYIVNFGSAKKPTFYGSISIVSEELKRANMLGAELVMTHLGSFKDLGQEAGMKQAQQGLKSVLEKYEADPSRPLRTKFLLEIAAGSGEVIGDTFEELAELMEPLTKFKTFGGICFDTQHAFSSGYDLRTAEAVKSTFTKFDKVIGLKWLKMSHINDSKIDLGGRKDRHEHIGEGKIGEQGFEALLQYFSSTLSVASKATSPPSAAAKAMADKKGEKNNVLHAMPLILETEHDKVEQDIEILKKLRNKIYGK